VDSHRKGPSIFFKNLLKEAAMFDSVRLPHRLDKQQFAALSEPLREKLLDAQFELAERKHKTVLLLINGSDGAGKGEVLNRLYEWLDDHYLETLSYGAPTEEERARPLEWRYWRDMPTKGRIGLMLGSWHHRVLRDRAMGRMDRDAFNTALEEINRVEEMLYREGVLVLKVWLYMGEQEARQRLAKSREAEGARRPPTVIEWGEIRGAKDRARLARIALEMVEKTSTGYAPWEVVAARDARYRDAAVADLLLRTLERENAESAPVAPAPAPQPPVVASPVGLPRASLVSSLDLTQSVDAETYAASLRDAQERLAELTTSKKFSRRGLVLVFEGNDAAGKGGAIRRVRVALDPRRFRVHGVAAPTDEEYARPYLWRFWRNIPRLGHVAIFDRSWYGRVLVERVEGLCARDDWMRAYQEINDFEGQLARAGLTIIKFWLAIGAEEQLARLKDREARATKRYKITPDDWRNREKWPLYEEAANEMIDRTSARRAPWTLVEANDKKFARLKVLRTIVEQLEREL
jgi:AMP-polyphosphate phosphotransferase